MKTCIKTLFILPLLAAGLGLATAGRVTAQTFANLYNFTATDPDTGTNNDGASPDGYLVLAGNILYGNTSQGGTNGNGTVFALNIQDMGCTNLHSFTTIDPNTAPTAMELIRRVWFYPATRCMG